MSITLNGTTGITTPALDSVAPFSSADMPAGSVIQVVHSTYSTVVTGTAGAEVFTGVSASITPTSASSKILIIFNGPFETSGTKSNFAVDVKLRRGTSTSSTLLSTQRNGHYHGATINAQMSSTHGFNYLDSPATTSSVTYGLFVDNIDGSPVWTFNGNSGKSEFTFMEIAA
jgi:hypothetical protein